MKLIIDIPDYMYEFVKAKRINGIYQVFDAFDAIYVSKYVREGTPLPKGHGRLIDADAYIDKYENFGWLDDIAVNEFNAITPTIIEADKEGNEK